MDLLSHHITNHQSTNEQHKAKAKHNIIHNSIVSQRNHLSIEWLMAVEWNSKAKIPIESTNNIPFRNVLLLIQSNPIGEGSFLLAHGLHDAIRRHRHQWRFSSSSTTSPL
jgi:hypothetical protein